MSEEQTDSNAAPKAEPVPVAVVERDVPPPETQHERWMKYGANVALMCVVVVVLAGILIWASRGTTTLTSHLHARPDLTGDASNKLRPQTVEIIRNLPSKITLVSVYPKLKSDDNSAQADTYQKVVDKLDEYKRNSNNIDVQIIDPVNDPAKMDAWLGELKRKYGGNISSYEDVLKSFPKTIDEIKKQASAEDAQIDKAEKQLSDIADKITNQQGELLAGTIVPAQNTVRRFPQVLEQINTQIKQELEQKIPNYEGAMAGLKAGLQLFSRQCEGLTRVLTKLKDDKDAPEPAKQYAIAAIPRFEAMKKLADDALNKTKNLGELKLEEVRRKLIPAEENEPTPPAIAVMGENDIKVIDLKDTWKSGESTGLTGPNTEKPRLRFTGEQQITAAILSLTQPKKQKIAFVRAGGAPLATSGMFGEAAMSDIADRLRSYNYDIVEKDISGQFAMMAMQQRLPAPPEASDEDLKDALWVVVVQQNDPRQQMPPAANLDVKLKEHLDSGGSALCLCSPHADDLALAVSDWGIRIRTDAIIMHEPITAKGSEGEDFIEMARRMPWIHVLNSYGDSPFTKPLQSLDSAWIAPLPIQKSEKPLAPGTTMSQILPIPNEPPSWGETNFEESREMPKYDKAVDLPAPLFAGAFAERAGKGRLVVVGSASFVQNNLLRVPDLKLQKQKIEVARFPGNGELFTNSVFWLTHNEKLIALSPAAMDTARIQPMSAGMLAFWRWGIFLVGLPLAAVFAGVMVYQSRRD